MTPEQIAQRVEQLADALVDRYDGRRVVVLTVLAGAIVFLANLIRRLPMPLEADLVGFDVPDAFVVGYGLDFNGLHRNLPDIRVLSVHDEGSLA
ncbi:MAG TPA: hypothetical protein ENH80_10125 [Phycisphaerae bacterium]|nr:hypothetical protein [Phycisphaerae bacterium]HDZ44284.1 hypothetical protein [Phycisphaerae bacterium]